MSPSCHLHLEDSRPVCFCMTLRLMIIHHHTKFGNIRFSVSGDIVQTKPGQDAWMLWFQYTPLPKISLRGGGGGWGWGGYNDHLSQDTLPTCQDTHYSPVTLPTYQNPHSPLVTTQMTTCHSTQWPSQGTLTASVGSGLLLIRPLQNIPPSLLTDRHTTHVG